MARTTAQSPIARAIHQERGFRDETQEAVIGIMLAGERLRARFSTVLQKHGDLTLQQYNVLRILRGAEPEGLSMVEISERMIERSPGTSRMIDRLEAKHLVERERAAHDRRVVTCRITETGQGMLRELDGPMDASEASSLQQLSKRDQKDLVTLLAKFLDAG